MKAVYAGQILLMGVLLFCGCRTGSQEAQPENTSTVAPAALEPTAFPGLETEAIDQPGATSLEPPPTSMPAILLDGRGGGLVAFYSDRDGNPEIYVMNADGSAQTRLTNDPAHDVSPALSPDGRRIAFLTSRHDPEHNFPDLKYELYLVDVDSGDLQRLTTSEAAETHPAWSPDGAYLTFDADYDDDGFIEINRINPDGSGLARLTDNPANDQFASISPDGRRIVFCSDRDGNFEIYVMNVDGSDQQRITDTPEIEFFPEWSPDGRKIAFARMQAGSRNADVYMLEVKATGEGILAGAETLLAASPRYDENPVWSPDGTQIVFQSDRSGGFDLYLTFLDGSEPQPLVSAGGNDFWPSWATPGAGGEQSAVPLDFRPANQEFARTGPFQIGLADLDGDGDLDAVFANTKTNPGQVWLNDGAGYYTDTGQTLTTYGHGVGIADWDQDGYLDLFFACHYFYEPAKIYLNDGLGNFLPTGQDLGDKTRSGADLELVDLNNDGQLDVHVMYFSPQGEPDSVYLNQGDGSFTPAEVSLNEDTLAWGDLDGDGDADLFGKFDGRGYQVRLNDGQGDLVAGWSEADAQAALGDIALADFDSDGDLDALVANGQRALDNFLTRLFWNDGTGQFRDSGQILNPTQAAEFGVGDLDLDSDLDVFVSNMEQSAEVWLNSGAGVLLDSGLRLEGTMSTRPSLGDVDGDGDLDVFIGSLGGAPRLWLNQTLQR